MDVVEVKDEVPIEVDNTRMVVKRSLQGFYEPVPVDLAAFTAVAQLEEEGRAPELLLARSLHDNVFYVPQREQTQNTDDLEGEIHYLIEHEQQQDLETSDGSTASDCNTPSNGNSAPCLFDLADVVEEDTTTTTTKSNGVGTAHNSNLMEDRERYPGNPMLMRSMNTPNIYYFHGTLNMLSLSTDGLYRIVSGPNISSSDFSEMFAGIVLSSIYGRLSIVGIDKTLPRAMRTFSQQTSGVPDLYMVSRNGADTGDMKLIVSVKRMYVHDDRVNRENLTIAILNKAIKGLKEYLSVVPLPGKKLVIVLTGEKEDARFVYSVYQRYFQVAFMEMDWDLYVIAVCDKGDLHRLVFKYTLEDRQTIMEMFNGMNNLDFVKVNDVPWLNNNMWGLAENQEDMHYEDLVDLFGTDFLGGT